MNNRLHEKTNAKKELQSKERLSQVDAALAKYFEQILTNLMSDRSIRMVRFEGTREIWDQRRSPSSQSQDLVRIQPKGDQIPLIAVSRHAEALLLEFRIPYLDPKKISTHDLKKQRLPIASSSVSDYLFVPNLSTSTQPAYTIKVVSKGDHSVPRQ